MRRKFKGNEKGIDEGKGGRESSKGGKQGACLKGKKERRGRKKGGEERKIDKRKEV